MDDVNVSARLCPHLFTADRYRGSSQGAVVSAGHQIGSDVACCRGWSSGCAVPDVACHLNRLAEQCTAHEAHSVAVERCRPAEVQL
eukprot:1164235-Rhodomonas_salina.1